MSEFDHRSRADEERDGDIDSEDVCPHIDIPGILQNPGAQPDALEELCVRLLGNAVRRRGKVERPYLFREVLRSRLLKVVAANDCLKGSSLTLGPYS